MTRVGTSIALAALLAACGSHPGTGDDTPDGGTGGGLSLAFSITPAVPGDIIDGLTVDSVELSIKDLRLTGDAAPGDDRTRAAYLAISWHSEHQPYPATFPQAPSGLYSNLAFKLENDTGTAFRMHGTTIFFDGKVHPFEIESENGLDVSVPMNVMLPAGGTATDTLETHVITVLTGLDWSKMTLSSDGTLELQDGGEVSALRERFVSAFSTASTDTK